MKSSNAVVVTPPVSRRRNRTELAFLPAALEIVETPPSPTGRAIAITIMGVFLAALAWACFSRIDIISSAEGRIVPTDRVKIVQPMETGIVGAIQVTDGQKVKSGQVLVELDPTTDRADVNHIRSDLLADEVAIARLRAALGDSAFHPPAAAPRELVAIEARHLFDQAAEQRDKLNTLDREQVEKEAERATASATIDGLRATIPVQTQLLDVYKTLFHNGNGSKVQYLQTLETLVDQQHQLVAQRTHYLQAAAAVAEIASSRQEAIAKYRSDLSDELAKTEAKAAGLMQDLIKAEERAKLQVLRAPVDGVVQQLAIHTVGEVVTPAQPLLVVVPLDSRLEIEAMIPNREIGFIRTGQKAEIKVAAFNYTQYGLLHGQVINVSRDSIAEQPTAEKADASVSGASGRSTSEQLLYSAHISLDRQRMLINGRYINLRPGMAVTVEIKTGSHRIISYLLSPLARYAHEAMHER